MYIMYRGSNGLGATDCGTNAHLNTQTGNCDCNPGFSWENVNDPNNMNCVPGCAGKSGYRSPLDQSCHCAPGMVDLGKGCEQAIAFPGCVDSAGQSVPGCLFGRPMTDVLITAAVGAGIGLALGGIIFGLRK